MAERKLSKEQLLKIQETANVLKKALQPDANLQNAQIEYENSLNAMIDAFTSLVKKSKNDVEALKSIKAIFEDPNRDEAIFPNEILRQDQDEGSKSVVHHLVNKKFYKALEYILEKAQPDFIESCEKEQINIARSQ